MNYLRPNLSYVVLNPLYSALILSIVILLQKLFDVICDAETVPNQNEGLLQCQNAQLIDHIYSQNKLINALNLRKTSVYV